MPPSTPNLSYRSTHPPPLTEQAEIAMMMQQYQSNGWIRSTGRARLKHEEETTMRATTFSARPGARAAES
jgi:hypothetical protein